MTKPRKLTRKLWGYFALSLLLFSLLIGMVFSFLFVEYNSKAHRSEMQRQAETLAAALPAFRGQDLLWTEQTENDQKSSPQYTGRGAHHGRMMHGGRGYSVPGNREWCRHSYSLQGGGNASREQQTASFLRDLDRLVQGTVWIVDRESRTISSYGQEKNVITSGLPAGMEDVLEKTLAGDTPVVDTSTDLFAEPMVTAGAPIWGDNGEIKGAVLVHRHLADLKEAEISGLQILGIAILLGLLLSALLAAALAKRFIAPLYRMKDTAEAFRAGDYQARTGLHQNDELGLLAESLDELGMRLEEAKAERDNVQKQRQEFLAAVSHELRTPLTVIKGTWELLESGIIKEGAKLQECRQRIAENLAMLERLVRDLLELTRLQSPGFQVQMESLNLSQPFADAIRSANTLAEKKGVKLEADLPQLVPFMGDYGRLRQLLLIILDNAIKFSPSGTAVDVQGQLTGTFWQIKVTDQGPGIAPEERLHIFDRFKKSGEDNAQGTGLGLAIAREIAIRHNIEIKCESELGKGAVFILQGQIEPVR